MQAEIRGHLVSVAAPVFLADMDHATSRLRLHVRRGIDVAAVRSRVQAAIDAAGQPVEVAVRSHDLEQLAYPRSLEHWLGRFRLGDVVYDPTAIASCARALLLAAKACRDAMDRQVKGIFFDPSRRTLLVLVQAGKDGVTPATLDWVRNLVDEAWVSGDVEAVAKVSLEAVVSLPRGDLVPVDAASAPMGRWISTTIRRGLAPLALMLAAGAISGPAAAMSGNARQPTFSTNDSQSGDRYGVLSGLSVFAEGQRRYELDAFASRGLNMFFGSTVPRGPGVQVAQGTVLRARLSDVDTDTANPGVGDGATGVQLAQIDIGRVRRLDPAGTRQQPEEPAATLAVNSRLLSRDLLQTSAKGRVDLLFEDGSRLDIGPGSVVTLDDYVYKPGSGGAQATFSMTKGMMRFTSGDVQRDRLIIRTPTATMGVRGTAFMVAVLPNGTTRVEVQAGLVLVWACGVPLTTKNAYLAEPGYRVEVTTACTSSASLSDADSDGATSGAASAPGS
jgi:hypothetical protein